MLQPARTRFVRLALIEGAVIALGFALLGLLGVAACVIDPQLYAATLLPPAN
ncbi:MAG TPA: hypothetical protein VEN28_14390 [Burkholderiaceae bacterium]|jgi:hypothetical protein|nr:hypothetical protein [Burkholderiaceae bacterium]